MDLRNVEGRLGIPDHSGSTTAWYMIERNEMQAETEETHLEYVCDCQIEAGKKLERHYHTTSSSSTSSPARGWLVCHYLLDV